MRRARLGSGAHAACCPFAPMPHPFMPRYLSTPSRPSWVHSIKRHLALPPFHLARTAPRHGPPHLTWPYGCHLAKRASSVTRMRHVAMRHRQPCPFAMRHTEPRAVVWHQAASVADNPKSSVLLHMLENRKSSPQPFPCSRVPVLENRKSSPHAWPPTTWPLVRHMHHDSKQLQRDDAKALHASRASLDKTSSDSLDTVYPSRDSLVSALATSSPGEDRPTPCTRALSPQSRHGPVPQKEMILVLRLHELPAKQPQTQCDSVLPSGYSAMSFRRRG